MEFSLTKEFSFEMAHALKDHDGLCKNIHGHSYKLHVTISGKPNQDKTSPKYGMLMDFGDLKKIVCDTIICPFDHALVLHEDHPFAKITNTNLITVPFQPTCENLLLYFSELMIPCFPSAVKLKRLRLYETAGSYAEIEFCGG